MKSQCNPRCLRTIRGQAAIGVCQPTLQRSSIHLAAACLPASLQRLNDVPGDEGRRIPLPGRGRALAGLAVEVHA
ncbi:hypothetical protein P9H28_22135, partial [Paenibacillus barengoltzii]|uniref:hypothetical protein n=1 Tax=Paenibacillus barengoltzii TaxID=343517 RepID=UPI002DC06058